MATKWLKSLISIRSLTDFHSTGDRQTRKSKGGWNSSPWIGKKTSPCVCATTEGSILILTHESKVNTPSQSRNRLRHYMKMVGGWEEGNRKNLTKYDRKCRNWKTFGYVWKELYVSGRNAHAEKKGGWQVRVNIFTNNPYFKRKNTMSKQTNFNINYFFNYSLAINFHLNTAYMKSWRLKVVISDSQTWLNIKITSRF